MYIVWINFSGVHCLVHLVSAVATLQFVEADYDNREPAQRVGITVSSSSVFTTDVIVQITPLLYSEFEQMGMQVPTGAPTAASG